MTQNNKEIKIESENSTPHKAKKKSHFLLKSFFVFLLTFVCLIIYKNLQNKEGVAVKKPIATLDKNSKEDSILDISEEYRAGLENETTVHDLNISEIKEKGAEFVYQLLIKNQVQIEDINNQLRNFKGDFIKLKSREKLNKLIVNYVELREKLFNGEECKSEIEGYDLLSVSDEFLQNKFVVIKEGYTLFSTQKKLMESFKAVTNQLIINENYNEKKASLFEKLRHNFNKLVVIRKVKNLNPDRLEGVINQIELALSQKNYQEALNKSLSLDKAYFPIIQKFLEELSIAIEIQSADKEIIKYLKSLT